MVMKKLMVVVVSALCAAITGGVFASVSVTPENCASVLAAITDGETYEFAAGDYPIAATIDLSGVQQGVTFVGAGADKTTLLPSSGFSGGFATGTGAANLTVRGIAFSGFKSSVFNLTTTHTLTITDCRFLNNSAANGPALRCLDVYDGQVTGSRFEGNTSTSGGGAIYLDYVTTAGVWQDTQLTVKNCVFKGNTAGTTSANTANGSAIYCTYHSLEIDNCLFTRNAGSGQTVYFYGWNNKLGNAFWTTGHFAIENSTIADNFTPVGLSATSRGTHTATNTIIFGQRYPIGMASGVNQLVDKGDCYWSGERPTTGTNANLLKGPEWDPQLDLNLRPPEGSPAYGHGYTFTDADPATVTVRDVYVDPNAEDSGDGSQGSPYNTFRAAVDAVQSGDRIHLAEGTYPVENYAFTDVLGIEILGEGAGAVFDGDGAAISKPVFSFTRANRFKVSKVTLTGLHYGDATGSFGFEVKRCLGSCLKDVEVTDNVISDKKGAKTYKGPVLYVGDWSTVDARRLTVSDNVLDSTTATGAQSMTGFIYSDCSYLTVRESVMRRNYLKSDKAASTLNGLVYANGNGINDNASKGFILVRDSLFQDNGRDSGEGMVGKAYALYAGWALSANAEHCTFDGFRGRILAVDPNGTLKAYSTVFHDFTYEDDNETDTPGGMWNVNSSASGNLYLYNCAMDYDYDTLKRGTGGKYLSVKANAFPVVGDPKIDADGMPVDVDGVVSPLVDAGYVCDFYGWAGDMDVLGHRRVVAYVDKTKAVPDIGCYELAPPTFRLTTTDVTVPFDGEPHGPAYELVIYDQTIDVEVSFSTVSEQGPFSGEEPKFVDAGTYPVWVKASAEGAESAVRLSTVTISSSISGNAYLDPNGTGDGSSPDAPSADVNGVLSRTLPGTTVHFAAGAYKMPEAVSLAGCRDLVLDGTAGAVIEPAEGMKDALVRIVGSSNVVFRGFVFRDANHIEGIPRADEPSSIPDVGSSFETVAFGGAVYGYLSEDCVFENCCFTDNTVRGTTTIATFGGAAAFLYSTNVVFQHCRFTGNTVESAKTGNGVLVAGGAIFFTQGRGEEVVDAVFIGNEVRTAGNRNTSYGSALAACHAEFTMTNALAVRNAGGQAPVATWGTSEDYRGKDMPFELYNCTFADNIATYGFMATGWVDGWTGKNLIVDGQFFSMDLDNGRATHPKCANNWWCGDSEDLGQTPEFDPHLVRGYVPAEGSGADLADAGWRPWLVTLDPSEYGTREVRVSSPAELAAAIADLRDGDTVRIAEGTYTMDEAAPFAYMISNRVDVALIGEGAGVTFDGDGGTLATTFLTVADSFNVRIENISLRNTSIPWTANKQTPPLAVSILRSGNVKVEAMSLESLRIAVTGSGITAAAGGVISCATADGFVMFHNLVIRDIDFDATDAPSATTVAGLAISSSSRLLVRGARFENIRFRSTLGGRMDGVVSDSYGLSTAGARVRNGLFTGCGIPDEEGLAGKAMLVWKAWQESCQFENCTFAGNRAVCFAGSANGAGYFHNCVFTDNAGGFVNAYVQAAVDCHFYNCAFDADPATLPIDGPLAPSGILASFKTNTDPIYGNVTPLGFKTTTGAKAYLPICTGKAESNSPLVDSGATMSWAKLWADADLLGNPRENYGVKPPRQNPPPAVIDRGCYECARPTPGLILMIW